MCNILHVSGYNKKQDGIIYILIWTSTSDMPFDKIPMGQRGFNNCAFKNCFLTGDHGYFENEIEFEVIMFNVVYLKYFTAFTTNRTFTQKYVMYAMEPAMYHYISQEFNGYFNLTFTYKLTSDSKLPYIIVKDANNTIIGPNINMNWMKLSDMNQTSDYVIKKLQNKRIAAAWVVSNCWSPWRILYANDLKNELARYGHRLDIYGGCGNHSCSYEKRVECFAIVESDYYFYLSFENSFGEDYVTEKILNALQHFTVPVVFGAANYSRFMPEGIYLNAIATEPYKLAEIMNNILKDKNKYYEFFKWHGHYSFHNTSENAYQEEVCSLCALLNNSMNQTSILDHIAEWWNEKQPIWPIWPTPRISTTNREPTDLESIHTISATTPEPTALESFISKLLDILDPSSDD